jgi:sulfate adenylyltransferase subunit 2
VKRLDHLDLLEAEAIHVLREVAAECDRPVLLYSMGKDSTVLVHLARKAFAPGPLPFPLLHVDSTFEFREAYAFRDAFCARHGLRLIVHRNERGIREGIDPFVHGSKQYTAVMRTEALVEALKLHGFDAALGGARRDEERARAKERIFSFRDPNQQWNPKAQRPELWSLYNAELRKGESLRVFPLSNWTELDIWTYVLREGLALPPLYFAAERPVVERDGTLIMVDDDRIRLRGGERPSIEKVRFRTLGCWPLTGGVRSEAATVPEVVREILLVKESERRGRLVDHDEDGSMETKKREGYF